MAVSATWIRNNMLFSNEQYERQLTEAELKVQRSLQKLSIPDWYLNKRSNPPKILNITPIDCRPPSWKYPAAQRNTSLNSVSSNLSDTLPLEDVETRSKNTNAGSVTSKSSPQKKCSDAKQKRSSSKSHTTKGEIFDTKIPEVKLPSNISKTFPKVSPSRKIQNINLVFPPGPKLELSHDLDDESVTQDAKYKTFVLKKQPADSGRKRDNDSKKRDQNNQKAIKKVDNDHLNISDIVSTPVRTPNVKAAFKVRATSTPKFTPAQLFSSTIIKESPRNKKLPSPSILEKSSIFENSFSSNNLSSSYAEKSGTARRKKLSESLLEKTSIFENSSKMNDTRNKIVETPVNVNKIKWMLERNIRSIDPILFEKDESGLNSTRSSSMIRDIMKKLEANTNSCHAAEKKRITTQLRNSNYMIREKLNLSKKQPPFLVQQKKSNPQVQSPCTRFMYSRRKSTDLENVVRSKEQPREKSVVRDIIETLTEKLGKTSLPRQNQAAEIGHQNFVKKFVNALEKGDVPRIEEKASPRSSVHEEDSSSESEAKYSSTSASVKDTDSSGSDYDQKKPGYKSDEEHKIVLEEMDDSNMFESVEKSQQEDDSVYWIPVSRCKLPRTSSLLSMMSRLSGNTQSPCVSPIRDEPESFQNTGWGITYRKTNGLSRKLFRIDETTILDSGYSDKSEKSGFSSASCLTDSTWSEDTQNDSGSDTKSTKLRRTSRRKSIVAHTCVH